MKTKPYNRHETFLAALSDSSITVPTPLSREELYLAKIAGENVTIPGAPYNRYETYLAKMAGESVTVPTPASRLECYLYKACGYDCNEPVPANREEIFWKRYVGSEATGRSVTINDSAVGSPRSFVVHVEPAQAGEGDPTPDNIRDISGWDSVSVLLNGEIVYDKNLSNTLYAGTVDIITGKVVTSHKLVRSSSTSGWANITERRFFRYNLPSDAIAPNVRAAISTGWCNMFRVLTDLDYDELSLYTNAMYYCNSGLSSSYKRAAITRFNWKGVSVNDMSRLTDFFFDGGEVDIVYKLASPTEEDIGPATITLTPGSNTFTCNCGTITLKYTPDL